MNGGKLPEGWVETPLENIVEILDSMRIPVNNKERQKRIEGKDFNKLYPYYGATGEIGKIDDFIFDEELIALGEDGVPFFDGQKNKAYMLYGKTWVNNHAHVLKAIQGLSHNKFLCYFLNQFDYHDYVNGGTRLKLTQANMRKIPVRFAPFSEQKIIAEKLDILLAQVDSTKARLEQIPQILKRFRQAVLAAAVNGKLADRLDGNRHWQEQQLSHVASHIVDCPHSTPKWSSEGKYCVRTTAFSPFYLDLSYQGYVDEETYQNRIQRLKPEPDDILYSREGTIGIACQIPKGVELCLGQRMVLIRASDKISSKYLTIVLNSNNILKIVRSKTMGSTAPRINMSDIKSYPIPLPPLQEQHEIVRRVELLFAYADTIEKQVNSALTRVNSLTQSILAKAFRGELTAQWRAENPDLISGENSAAALLEKIKAERAASGGKKTSRKKA